MPDSLLPPPCFVSRVSRLVLLATLAAGTLAACATGPRGAPAPVVSARPTPPAPPAAPAPAPASEPAPAAAPEGAVTSPVLPSGSDAGGTPADDLVPPPAEPYGPAVAARFPEPAVRYDTPGLAQGRSRFTTEAELQALLRELVAASGKAGGPAVSLLSLGNAQSGHPLEALLFARSAEPDGASLRRAGRPTVLVLGQQHGDEPASAEALLVIARELAAGRLAALLEKINVVVMPRVNPDGAESHRRAANGGIDINRDHLLLKTPEAQALARLVRDYQPAVVVDAHEYSVNGRFQEKFAAVQRFDALLQYAMTANVHPFVTRAAEEWFRRPMASALQREQLSTEWYYTVSADPADKTVSMGGVQPEMGRNANGLRNSVSLLVETRGGGLGRLHMQRRVHTHVTAVSSALASAAGRAADLLKLRQFVDSEVSAQACRGDALIEAAPVRTEYRLLALDPQTGADKALMVDWNSSLTLEPRKIRTRPCGYWLAQDATDAVTRLQGLGVQVQQLQADASAPGSHYRELARGRGARPDTGPGRGDPPGVVSFEVDLVDALIDMPAGSYYVPLTQPLANLAIAALEPDTQSSFVANGILPGVDRLARVRLPPEARLSTLP